MSDHFYYMSAKLFSDGEIHSYFSPFNSPYEAFINYMNILSDFMVRLNAFVPESKTGQEIAILQQIIDEKDKKLRKIEADLLRVQKAGRKKTVKN